MSTLSRLRKQVASWKQKGIERGSEARYERRQRIRIAKERDELKKENKRLKARIKELESENRGLPVQNKATLIFLAFLLFFVACISFRAVSRVLTILAPYLGIQKAPCTQTIINWTTRLSMVRMRSALTLKLPSLPLAPFSNGMIWIIDISIGLGDGKILTVLGLDARHHQLEQGAPGLEHVHCLAVSVAVSWTGEAVADLLKRLIAVKGRPAAYLKDGGTELRKAVRLLGEQGIGSPSIDDISHDCANLLKREYHDHPMFETFLSACGQFSGKVKQTILACLAPPKVQTKARFMNVHRLVVWADHLLKLSPAGRARKDSILSKLRAIMDVLPSCKALIKRFKKDAVSLLKCQEILKTGGLSHDTLAQCEPFIEAIPTVAIRTRFADSLQERLEIAKRLGLDDVGLPISSDVIESLFGKAKQHGIGEIKDADRIAIHIPALCGVPTQTEAEQVLGISVAEQNEFVGNTSSLTSQRRHLLKDPEPDRLESLQESQSNAHIELIPGAENRAKIDVSDMFTNGYEETSCPDLECRSGGRSP